MEFGCPYFSTFEYGAMVKDVKATCSNIVTKIEELDIATPSNKSNKVQLSIKQDKV